jgi:hypothetical protein
MTSLDCLMPPNLGAMGLPRRTADGVADLITVWESPYPVITRYKDLCRELKWEPFGGGAMHNQKARVPGFITSGYRDRPIGGNITSPHSFAFALDLLVGNAVEQVRVGRIALKQFCRIGLYPSQGFIHVDLAPDNWIEKHNKARYWVRVSKSIVLTFNDFEEAATAALG